MHEVIMLCELGIGSSSVCVCVCVCTYFYLHKFVVIHEKVYDNDCESHILSIGLKSNVENNIKYHIHSDRKVLRFGGISKLHSKYWRKALFISVMFNILNYN